MKEAHPSFIVICRDNYIKKITPSNKDSFTYEGYRKLVDIAKAYFDAKELESFVEYFQDGQYFINLWAAHLLIEFGNPPVNWRDKALEIILRYSDNPLAPDVAIEEKKWLELNYPHLLK
jgi:hypothetical protein